MASLRKTLHGHMHEPFHHGDGPAFPLQLLSDLINLINDLLGDELFQQMVGVLRGGHESIPLLRG